PEGGRSAAAELAAVQPLLLFEQPPAGVHVAGVRGAPPAARERHRPRGRRVDRRVEEAAGVPAREPATAASLQPDGRGRGRPAVTTADVRVGIVSWNTAALLDRCLTALPAALDGLDAEVVVVDNAS